MIIILPEEERLIVWSENSSGNLAEEFLQDGGDGVHAVVLDVHQAALQQSTQSIPRAVSFYLVVGYVQRFMYLCPT
jgi:hypothetical protein